MPKKNQRKLRTDFRKGHQGRVRKGDLTRQFRGGEQTELDDAVKSERVSGKGELTRKRTVWGADAEPDHAAGLNVELDLDGESDLAGRVISVHGLKSRVLGEDDRLYECSIRQVLKSLSTEQRNVVVAGDRVRFRAQSPTAQSPTAQSPTAQPPTAQSPTVQPPAEGVIVRVEPRHGELSRRSRGRQHVIVANVDYLVIVASAAEPHLKPALIDRFLLTAEQCDIEPVVVINKIDLVDPVPLQQPIGVYASLGYRTLVVSATTGLNVDYLGAILRGNQTVLAGQSGVGKSSLLNRVQPGLGLAVAEVSRENEKGRHTTTAARLIPIAGGGSVFDTPGIRQFQLWDIEANEVAGLMPDFRPHVSRCRYPNCLHLAEDDCAVKDAVADARIDARRYDAYCHLLEEDLLVGDRRG